MPRFTFFSFDYEDVKNFKANVVRRSWYLNNSANTFIDGSIWETEKTKSPTLIKQLIAEGLYNTSVTAILIGQNTASRRWVKYEIVKSFEKGNGILAIHINKIRDKFQMTSAKGLNPLDRLGFKISNDGKKIFFFELVNGTWKTYSDLPVINNKKSNTIYFEDHWWNGNDFGKSFRFSAFFPTYCWKTNEGNKNFSNWIDIAAKQAGR